MVDYKFLPNVHAGPATDLFPCRVAVENGTFFQFLCRGNQIWIVMVGFSFLGSVRPSFPFPFPLSSLSLVAGGETRAKEEDFPLSRTEVLPYGANRRFRDRLVTGYCTPPESIRVNVGRFTSSPAKVGT
jgi:hypothetical protein